MDVVVDPSPSTGWLDAWASIEQRADANETARQVLARIQAPTGYVIAHLEGVRAGVELKRCTPAPASPALTATTTDSRRTPHR